VNRIKKHFWNNKMILGFLMPTGEIFQTLGLTLGMTLGLRLGFTNVQWISN